MRAALALPLFIAAGLFVVSVGAPAHSDDKQKPAGQHIDPAAMMKRHKEATTPGQQHDLLERFVGKWDTSLEVIMPGMPALAIEGTAEFSWLMDGRWLQQNAKGGQSGNPMIDAMMPTHSFGLLGHDNYKKKYVAVSVDNKSTDLRTAYGNLTPDGAALILYGTLDEPMLQESDKMAKVIYRFQGDDKILMEIHDLAIGETNTKVITMTYTRKK